jgi:hypothetical protein
MAEQRGMVGTFVRTRPWVSVRLAFEVGLLAAVVLRPILARSHLNVRKVMDLVPLVPAETPPPRRSHTTRRRRAKTGRRPVSHST